MLLLPKTFYNMPREKTIRELKEFSLDSYKSLNSKKRFWDQLTFLGGSNSIRENHKDHTLSFLENNGLPVIILNEEYSIICVNKECLSLLGERKLDKDGSYSDIVNRLCLNKEKPVLTHTVLGKPYLLYIQKSEQTGLIAVTLILNIQLLDNKSEMIETVKEVKEQANSKELFLANMSHEIRTPLNAIIGISRLLKESNLTGKQSEYADIVNTCSINLKSIIDGILDLTKLNSGKVRLESTAFHLEELFYYCKSANEVKASENRNQIFCLIDPNINQYLKSDSTRLGQVINNLVSNAVKFTLNGTVVLKAELVRDNRKSQTIKISIQDDGIGIANEHFEKILKPFTQAELTTSKNYGGTGLGLDITSKLIKLFGSNLELESEVGKGSTFSFKVNLLKTEDEVNNQNDDNKIKSLAGKRILVVEDNGFNQTLMQGVLSSMDVDLTIKNNGREAIDFLKHNIVDIILMDIQMPLMDGIECTRIIRKELKLSLPIICLSANAMDENLKKYKQYGMDSYVTKPFEPEQLINAISGLIVNQELSNKTSTDMNAGNNEKLYNLDNLSNMLSGNEKYIKYSLRTLIQETPEVLEKLQNSFEVSDLTQISKLAHRLIASIKIMNIKVLIEPLIDLEKSVHKMEKEAIASRVELVIDVTNKVMDQIQELELNPNSGNN